jgi:hypothetical protein
MGWRRRVACPARVGYKAELFTTSEFRAESPRRYASGKIEGRLSSMPTTSRHPVEAVDHPVRVRIAQYDTLLHGHPRPSLRGKFLGSRQGF